MITMIACMSQNRVIGKDNDMPWHLPEDLKFFMNVTMGHTVVMGRKTFESIGKPLPGRKNVIVTRSKDFKPSGCEIVTRMEDILERKEDLFITGGAQLYEQFMPFADRLYLTVIHEEMDGDTFFPPIGDSWEVVEERKGLKNEQNPYEYTFYTYERRK